MVALELDDGCIWQPLAQDIDNSLQPIGRPISFGEQHRAGALSTKPASSRNFARRPGNESDSHGRLTSMDMRRPLRSDGGVSELVEAAKAGDRVAFGELIERDGPLAYKATLAILGSAEDARDAVQNASLQAWQRLPDLRVPSAWPSWYRQIAVRAAIDHARQRQRVREVSLLADLDGHDPDPAPALDERLTILAALRRLSPDDRAVLGLRFGADLEVPDIAATLGIRLGTAKARLHRALGRLRTLLGEDDGD